MLPRLSALILEPVYFNQFNVPPHVERLRTWITHLKHDEKTSNVLIREMEETAQRKEQMHVDNLIEGISNFFVPIFFVFTGLQVQISVFSDFKTVGIALVITAIAFGGKLACGYAAGKSVDCKLIGFGMVPRGEVGLIFLNVGKMLGVVSPQIFAIGVIMVILTTLLTPPVLNAMIRKRNSAKELIISNIPTVS